MRRKMGWYAVLTVVFRRLSEPQRMARFSLPRLGGGMDNELEDVGTMVTSALKSTGVNSYSHQNNFELHVD
jgi:hypothetical protein